MENVDIKELKKELNKEMRKSARAPMDLPFATLVILISSIGLIMMFSASYASAYWKFSNPAYFLTRQGPYLLLGIVAMYVISRFNYQILSYFAWPMMAVSVILLMLVPFIGTELKGAKRWIYFGPISVQPSEIAKIAVIVLFSVLITKFGEKMTTFKYGILPFTGILGVLIALLAVQPHLSGIVLIAAVGASLMFAGGVKLRYFAAVGVVAAAGGWLLVSQMEHAQKRINIWLDPWSDVLKDGFQAVQSQMAIGSGGLFGLGLGRSRQKFLYLPEQHNDFVFAIVCEELGMVGAFIVLLLFAFLVIRGYWIALHAKDRLGALLVTGVTTLLAIQTFFNVAVVTSLIPVTGISMPFFSFGGSSLLIQLAEMGIVLSVSRQITVTKKG